jgi:predicted amidophosphoribosyltransferase
MNPLLRLRERHIAPVSPEICPNCSAEVPSGARSCPECGADEETGWSEKARYDEIGVPDDSFDYDEFVKREFERKKPQRRMQIVWVIAAILLIVSFLLFLF